MCVFIRTRTRTTIKEEEEEDEFRKNSVLSSSSSSSSSVEMLCARACVSERKSAERARVCVF
jgi:hypothetical protein